MIDKLEVNDDDLKMISALANKQVSLENQIKLQEDILKGIKEEHKQVSQVDIPEALAEAGLSEFKLADGTKVTVQQFYSASIPKDKVDDAMQWLRDNGHGDLIKNTVSVAFGKGEDTLATDLKKYLGTNGNSYEDKTGVHPQTLRAFAREQIEAGQNLPLDTLGIYIGQKTVIKEG